MTAQELKRIKTRIGELKVKEFNATQEAKDAQRRASLAMNERLKLENELSALLTAKLSVSEHAILRYIERTLGVGTGRIERDILDEIEKAVKVLGGKGKFPLMDGEMVAVVKGGVVVTVEPR